MPTAVSRRSSVGTATGPLGWTTEGSPLYSIQTGRLCGHQSSVQQVPWAQSPEFTRPGRKAVHLPPSKWSSVTKEWVELHLHSSSCRRYVHSNMFTFTVLRLWPTRPSGSSWDRYLSFQNPVVTCIFITRSPQILHVCGCHLHVVQRSVQTMNDTVSDHCSCLRANTWFTRYLGLPQRCWCTSQPYTM